jgi:hypothetical protein
MQEFKNNQILIKRVLTILFKMNILWLKEIGCKHEENKLITKWYWMQWNPDADHWTSHTAIT